MTTAAAPSQQHPPARLDEIIYPADLTVVIPPRRVANDDASIPVFGADIWHLDALEASVTRRPLPLDFRGWPEGFRECAKHIAYALINYGNPQSLVESYHSNYAAWPAASTIQQLLIQMRTHVEWLMSSPPELMMSYPISSPADLDAEHLNVLRRQIEARGYTPRDTNKHLEIVVRIWHLSPWLPESARWHEPLWSGTNWRVPRKNEETRTERIPQEVMGPLLEWATAFVSLFADDIFAAHFDYRSHLGRQLALRGAASQLFDAYVRDGRVLPEDPTQSGRVSWQVVQYQSAIPISLLAASFSRRFQGRISVGSAPAELQVVPTARFHGEQWIPSFSIHDVTQRVGTDDGCGILLAHLRTACLIVCAYLTGARPEEVLGLQEGAAREPIIQPNGAFLYLVDGRMWKGRKRTESGADAPKAVTWATIPVTSKAVRVAEQINRAVGRPGGPLFAPPGRPSNPHLASDWIASFALFVNTRLAPHTSAPDAFTIPDVGGRLSLRRFRRTLAWFISNRPNGEVTTAIQYQHVSDRLVSGYAGTKESGMRDLLLEEGWKHRRQTIENLADLMDSGGKLYGPAAGRAATAVLGMPRFMTPADERRLRKEGAFVIFDNPEAVAICVWDEPQALCVKKQQLDGNLAPNLPGCVDKCPNCARTDEHLDLLEDEAASLRANAAISPQPIAQSMLARADRNEQIVLEGRPIPEHRDD